MTEMQRYLAEEVAEDLADGIISRREALRRLGLLGVTGTVATGLLAAAGNAAAAAREDSDNQGRSASGSETVWAPVAREAITFPGPAGPLMAAWAPASKPRGGVLVIHENRGVTEHISTIAGRLAASGYSALALDLLSQEGGHRSVPGRGRGRRRPRANTPGTPRRRHEGQPDRAQASRPWKEVGRDRVLLWRRHGVAPAHFQRTAPRRGRSVLWTVPGRSQFRGLPRSGSWDLWRTRRTGQRHAARGQGGARGRTTEARAAHLRRSQSRVLQRHGSPLQPACRGGGMASCVELVRRRRRPSRRLARILLVERTQHGSRHFLEIRPTAF